MVFASGDFAFNLYWQSVMLYLLYFYTEALHLSITVASAGYAIASIWDGIASLIVGMAADRYARPERLRLALVFGAIPLGVCFALAYVRLPLDEGAQLVWTLATHMLFRTAYALVNIPYLAMSSRISVESDDRALVAGGRMLFGTLAAVVVAVGTIPIGRFILGASDPNAYAASASCFALVGGALLLVVGLQFRDDPAIPAAPNQAAIAPMIRQVLRNRAFLTLTAAAMTMIIAVTVFDKSVLYFFKYALRDENAGQLTLGWMMAISGVAIPLWLALSRKLGVRAVWFLATTVCAASLVSFMLLSFHQTQSVQIFLVTVQVSIVGLHFAFWAMLPDTVEYGQRMSGLRAEAVLYGLSALCQRIAIGLGTLVVGYGLGSDGLRPSDVNDMTYRSVLALIPLGFFLLAGVLMVANPLKKGRHRQILAELEERGV